MANFKKRILSCLAVVAIMSAVIIPYSASSTFVSNNDEQPVANIENGSILHAFSWSFNTIKDNMKNIANSGFTAIQTSPVNTFAGEGTSMKLKGNKVDGSDGAWWWQYQPTDFKIGNYQLGTREELVEMCNEADKYGIKIIVDVVANNTTTFQKQVAKDLIDSTNGFLYHDTGLESIDNWGDRFECTRYSVSGLPDINTEHPGFQDYLIKYLNDCIDCGVDGFRYDKAKHIGLKNDNKPNWVENNFWEKVTTEINNADEIFSYGDVSKGHNNRVNEYIKEIGAATAVDYSNKIVKNIEARNLDTNSMMYYTGIDNPEKSNFITYAESYDDYINQNTSETLSETDIKLTWAFLAARRNGTPLFFSRPMNGGSGNKYGNNEIGAAGSTLYSDDEIAAVNFFRTYAGDAEEYISNPNGNKKVIIVERHGKGAVIINTSNKPVEINDRSHMLEKAPYRSWTKDQDSFYVGYGMISGTIPARSVRVIVPQSVDIPVSLQNINIKTFKVYYKTDWKTANAHYQIINNSWTTVPGHKMYNSDFDGYKAIEVRSDRALKMCFNNGVDWDNNNCKDYYLSDPGEYIVSNGHVLNVENHKRILGIPQ